jgi:hypothetical protein
MPPVFPVDPLGDDTAYSWFLACVLRLLPEKLLRPNNPQDAPEDR